MHPLSYRLTFTAPAFLGNVEQSGQWRTPPIKALLRQWWRVAYSADHGHRVDVAAMRDAEAALFGSVEGKPQQSKLRIRLSRWDVGSLESWAGLEQGTVKHPEVQQTRQQVGPQVYLGYGPLTVERGQTVLKKSNAAIAAGEHADLSLALTVDGEFQRLLTALALVDRFGALGGRSRNGWGSVALAPLAATPALATEMPADLLRLWKQALASDWPHAVGTDGRPLVWCTPPYADWRAAMRRLAEAKIGLRTQFRFTSGERAGAPEDRHWLSYPVTRHSVQSWEGGRDQKSLRLPNSLRFKLRPTPDGKVLGVIFHMPCKPPAAFRPDPATLERIWQRVHAFLDDPNNGLQLRRIPA